MKISDIKWKMGNNFKKFNFFLFFSYKKFLIGFTLTYLLFAICYLWALNNPTVGTSSAQFLKLGVNARAMGMGEAYSTVAEDSSALYWNPAGIGLLQGKSISMMHAAYLENIFYDFFSYSQAIPKIGSLGMSIQYLISPNIDQTDDLGRNVGTFRTNDLAVSFGYGTALEGKGIGGRGRLALGIAGKFIRSSIVDSANTGAVDFGLVWSLTPKMRFGLAFQNLGGKLKFVNRSEELPVNLKLGSSYRPLEPLMIAMDINFPRDNDPNIGLGAEYSKKIAQDISFAGRIGYNSRTTADISGINSMSVGTGFGWKNYGLDFSWLPFGALGHTYRFSLSARF